MTKRRAVHFQPASYPKGYMACNNFWTAFNYEWTDDPLMVKCGNCERTEVYKKAYESAIAPGGPNHRVDLFLIEAEARQQEPGYFCAGFRSAEKEDEWAKNNAIKRHITGDPVLAPWWKRHGISSFANGLVQFRRHDRGK